MTELLAYRNGRFLPATELHVPVYDLGFLQGATVAEQMRTFGGRIFRLQEHLERLQQSLETVGLVLPVALEALGDAAKELAAHNRALLVAGDDLALVLFATPGPSLAFAPDAPAEPFWAMHTYPVAFAPFASKYDTGESLVSTSVRQIPTSCWPSHLKCRSRMHYFLADQEARRQSPGARALLLDQDGYVAEASTANVLVYSGSHGVISPPLDKILPGISLSTLNELTTQLGVPFEFRDLTLDEVTSADEVLLCSTSPCVLPVTSVDGVAIGQGKPGPFFQRLLAAWSELVAIDIRAQAQQFQSRR